MPLLTPRETMIILLGYPFVRVLVHIKSSGCLRWNCSQSVFLHVALGSWFSLKVSEKATEERLKILYFGLKFGLCDIVGQ